MIPRHVILSQPHMQHLIDLPELNEMPDDELRALEGLMAFCADQELEEPLASDIRAYCELQDQSPADLEVLSKAMWRLGMPDAFLASLEQVNVTLKHRVYFKGITKGRNRDYEREVSVPVEELPADWQITLRKLHRLGTLDRMKSRLCMFAWSARQAGLPVDLGCIEALQAFYQDIRSRSIARQREQDTKQGVLSDIAAPRWAYLRGTWEELYRFAWAHGCHHEALEELGITFQTLASKEAGQSSQKMTKVMKIGSASSLLAIARQMLTAANDVERADWRHARRNSAAAIALGIGVPARPRDVFEHHIFGEGIFYENGVYLFRYHPRKTRRTINEPFEVELNPEGWSPFIDALILQDQDPRYLDELRAKALAERRPLYVNYDSSRCVYPWYSRQWAKVTGTGGHIARTLIYDEMAGLGEFGLMYSKSSAHHVTNQISDKYRSDQAIAASQKIAKSAMVARGGDDDLSAL
tara:strand:- start:704 stop:2110 length:1407 start_codon:yes stop_codon:yes gene_type:complete